LSPYLKPSLSNTEDSYVYL